MQVHIIILASFHSRELSQSIAARILELGDGVAQDGLTDSYFCLVCTVPHALVNLFRRYFYKSSPFFIFLRVYDLALPSYRYLYENKQKMVLHLGIIQSSSIFTS